jgi:hypothetical protein
MILSGLQLVAVAGVIHLISPPSQQPRFPPLSLLIPSFPFPSKIEIEKLNLKRPSAVRTARRSVDRREHTPAQSRNRPARNPESPESPESPEKKRNYHETFSREGQKKTNHKPKRNKAKEPWLYRFVPTPLGPPLQRRGEGFLRTLHDM